MKWASWVKFDKTVNVSRKEAIKEVINIARKEGILIGLSSGAVIAAIKKLENPKGNIIAILPDSGFKYFEQLEDYLNRTNIG